MSVSTTGVPETSERDLADVRLPDGRLRIPEDARTLGDLVRGPHDGLLLVFLRHVG